MIPNLIDAHVHVWTPASARFPRDLGYIGLSVLPVSFTPERLLEICTPLGVRRVVLVQMSFYGTDNSYMLDAMKRYPSVFSGIAVVDHEAASLDAEMARLASLGVRGFRITPVDRGAEWLGTGGMFKMWRLAAEKQLAICPLICPDTLSAVDRMCARFPDTVVVIDHMARIGMDGALRSEDIGALSNLARHRSLYVKISAFYALGKKQYPYTDLSPVIRALYDAYGPRRLMWGSDSPFQLEPPHSYSGSLEFVLEHLDFLNSEDKEWMLHRTAETVFF